MDKVLNQLPWDVKSTINKVKNAVMNYTEMEAKVRDATNADAWGASSTLLQEIARGTGQYQYFNEIMPTIYKRFAEDRRSWRQVYKTLQLIEYLLKNGSERVIESVRDHIYEIKSLTNYQFIDEKGKDQGINVRHRAKEIVELVGDNERLEAERQKAQANRNKYGGVSSDEARYGGFGNTSGGFGNTGNKYGGFGSDQYSGNLTATSATPKDLPNDPSYYGSSRRDSETKTSNSALPQVKMNESSTPAVPLAAAPAKAASANLLDLDFDAPVATQAAPAPTSFASWGNSAPVANGFGAPAPIASFAAPAQDDFADFQSAPVFQSAQPSPASAFANFTSAAAPANTGFSSFTAAPMSPSANTGFGSFTAAPGSNNASQNANLGFSHATPAAGLAPTSPAPSNNVPKKPGDIWNSNLVALDSLGKFNYPSQKDNGPALNQLASTPVVNASNNGFGGFVGAPASGFGNFATAPASATAQQQNGWNAPQQQQQQNDLLF